MAILLAAPAVFADGGGGPVSDLKACKGLPHGAATSIKDDAVVIGDKLAFPALEGGGCEVYSLAKGVKTTGTFGTAVAIPYATCTKDSCPIVVAIRGADGKVTSATRTDQSCDRGVQLQAIRMLPDRDDLLLICRQSAGAGWNESRSLIDASVPALFYTVGTGSYIALTPAEKKAGEHPSCPVGSIVVEKTDASPILRVADAAAGTLKDGKGVLAGKQYAYDPAHHKLTPTGAPDKPIAVDAHTGCK